MKVGFGEFCNNLKKSWVCDTLKTTSAVKTLIFRMFFSNSERTHAELLKSASHELAAAEEVAASQETLAKEIKDFADWMKETSALVQQKEPVVCTSKEAEDDIQKHYVSLVTKQKKIATHVKGKENALLVFCHPHIKKQFSHSLTHHFICQRPKTK